VTVETKRGRQREARLGAGVAHHHLGEQRGGGPRGRRGRVGSFGSTKRLRKAVGVSNCPGRSRVSEVVDLLQASTGVAVTSSRNRRLSALTSFHPRVARFLMWVAPVDDDEVPGVGEHELGVAGAAGQRERMTTTPSCAEKALGRRACRGRWWCAR